jgi:hypothetical protein
MSKRRERLVGTISIANSRGLEIGALNAPLVRKSEGRVQYVDYAKTETLRKNQHDPAVILSDIVDVDIIWGNQSLRQEVGGQVDYVVASHVIEHVPDLIGWLCEIHDVLVCGGTLGLAVPDRRFTFDLWRRESTLAEAVEAYLLRYRCPSVRQVFDVASLAVAVDAATAWQTDLKQGGLPEAVLAHLPAAFALTESLISDPRYVDAHCWVFTPATFLDMAEGLLRLDLFPFAIAEFFPTEPGELEFHIRFTALARNRQDIAAASIAAARQALACNAPWPPAQPSDQPDLSRMQNENAELRQAIESILRSTSWRVTAPLRAVARRLGRGGS